MSDRYLKQIIVVRKDLSMPTGKLAAMVAHASMTFILKRLNAMGGIVNPLSGYFSRDEIQWLTELDPGLEHIGQISMAKIVCSVDDDLALEEVEAHARAANLEVWRVTDSGHSHNKMGDVAAIAIGPDWPEALEPVTGNLKVYR